MRLLLLSLALGVSSVLHAATIKDACTMRLDMPLSHSVYWYVLPATSSDVPVLCAVAMPVSKGSVTFIVTIPGQPDTTYPSRDAAITWAESQTKQ